MTDIASLVWDMPIILGVRRRDFSVEFLGTEIESLTGFPAASLNGADAASYTALIHPDDRSAVAASFATAMRRHDTYEIDYRIITADGSCRWLCERGNTLVDEKGKPWGAAIVLTDISRHKYVQDSLEKAQRKYYELFNSIDEGFCLIRVIFDENERPVDYEFLEVNQAFESMSGLHDAVGRRMREFAPNHEQYWFDLYGNVAATGEPKRFENRAAQLGRDFDVYAFRTGDPDDRVVAVLFRDITARKQAEDAMIAASTFKDEFLGLVSHELRNPLTTVRGNAYILARNPNIDDDMRTNVLSDLLRETERTTRILENMLVLGRLQAGQKPHVEPMLAGREVRRAVNGFIGERFDNRLQVGDVPESAIVTGVEEYLDQTMRNLLSNAYKYSPAGSPIDVYARVLDGHVAFSVADRGGGLADPEGIFSTFAREASSDVIRPGLGLGLAVCKRLVEAQDGEIWAEARDGGGTVVSFTLPLHRAGSSDVVAGG